jgi:hypothetical protein
MVQAAYHRKLLKAGMKVHLHRLTLSGCGTRLSDGRTNSASSPSESVAGLPKRGPVSIRGRGPKKSGCKLSGHLDDKRACGDRYPGLSATRKLLPRLEVAHLKSAANSTSKKVLGNFQEIDPFSAGIRMRHSLRALPIHLRNVCLFPFTKTGEHPRPNNGVIDFR